MTAHPPSTVSKCPTGCGRSVRPRRFFCPVCTPKIPADLHRKMRRAWAAFLDETGDWQAFETARAEALEAIS